MEQIKEFLDELMERSTPQAPVWNQEDILEGKPSRWSYIDGCMALALLNIYEATKEEKYFTFLDEFIDYFVAADGSLLGYNLTDYNCDSINEGKVLFSLYEKTGKEKYKKAIELLMEQVQHQPRNKAKSFWHKLIYPNQVWLDSLYMVGPFYLQYEKHFNHYQNLPDIMRQFANVEANMRDAKTGLYYHGYDESREVFWANPVTGCSQNFWTRSLGWFAMALVDTLADLDPQFVAERQTLTSQFQHLMAALVTFADEQTQLFYQVTDQQTRAGNYLETSGTCAIAYALMKGARLGFLSAADYARGEVILENVVKEKLTKENGHTVLTGICLVAGLGGMNGKGNYLKRDGSYAYYISEPVVKNDAKGIAPLMFAYAEYLKHGN
jgi:unsaturated rhamnogalacturonyl hydrolase